MKIATVQEAINGNSNDTAITPLRLKQVLSKLDISSGGGIETETDPVFTSSPAAGINTSNIASWNAKQDTLVSGQNIKTINGQDILGEGDITIESSGGGSGVSIDMIYPVGSIYISASATVNPNVIFTGTQWERFGKGKTLIGVDEVDTDFATVGLEGGSKDATVVKHSHTVTGEAASNGAHTHTVNGTSAKTNGTPDGLCETWNNKTQDRNGSTTSNGAHTHTVTGTTNEVGEDGTGKNLQPFITVFMWKRVV